MSFSPCQLPTRFAIFASAMLACGIAMAQTSPSKLYRDEPGSTARAKETLAISPGLPLKKRYAEFNEQERQLLHSQYESLAPGDEPPFPVNGLAPIFRQLADKLGGAIAPGLYHLVVTVTPGGEAKSVSLIKQPSVEHAKLVAYYLVTTKYKPAVCGGQPCTMDFQLAIEF